MKAVRKVIVSYLWILVWSRISLMLSSLRCLDLINSLLVSGGTAVRAVYVRCVMADPELCWPHLSNQSGMQRISLCSYCLSFFPSFSALCTFNVNSFFRAFLCYFFRLDGLSLNWFRKADSGKYMLLPSWPSLCPTQGASSQPVQYSHADLLTLTMHGA